MECIIIVFLKNKDTLGPVLIKLPKKNQILELDMPVIGIDTVKLAFKLNYFGIVFKYKGVLLINEKRN